MGQSRLARSSEGGGYRLVETAALLEPCPAHWLPAEMLGRVFRLLGREVRVVVQVCRRWREAGQAPGLWRWAVVRVDARSLAALPGLLTCGRLRAAARWRVTAVSEHLLAAMAAHRGVREVDMSYTPLAKVEALVVADMASRLDTLSLRGTGLTRWQLEAVLRRVGEEETSLRSLDLSSNNLSSVTPGLLAAAVVRLEEVHLDASGLSTAQVETLLTAVCGGSNLRTLSIATIRLGGVEPLLLALALNRLEEVWVHETRLTADQLVTCLACSLATSSLRRLHMEGGRAVGEAPALWAWAMVYLGPKSLANVVDLLGATRWTLDMLRMNNARVTKEVVSLVQVLTVTNLDLSFTHLAHLDPAALATALTLVRKVNLKGSELTKKQLKVLLARLGEGPWVLRSLDLGENNLSSVGPELLAAGLAGLQEAGLWFTQLSAAQVEAVLATVTEDSGLRLLSLADNRLGSVDTALLARSVHRLDTVCLCGTKLSATQLTAILAHGPATSSIARLYIDAGSGVSRQVLDVARRYMAVTEVSVKEREKEFLANEERMLKILGDYGLS